MTKGWFPFSVFFCFTGLFSRDYCRSGWVFLKSPKGKTKGIASAGCLFHKPDALPVIQPSVSLRGTRYQYLVQMLSYTSTNVWLNVLITEYYPTEARHSQRHTAFVLVGIFLCKSFQEADCRCDNPLHKYITVHVSSENYQ